MPTNKGKTQNKLNDIIGVLFFVPIFFSFMCVCLFLFPIMLCIGIFFFFKCYRSLTYIVRFLVLYFYGIFVCMNV